MKKCGEPLPPDVAPGHCPKCLMQLAFERQAQGLSGSPTVSPGQSSQTWDPDRLAALFPELEIIEQVGSGGMGVVYKARQKQLDRMVAVKLVRPDLCDDPAFAERFTREARAMARLTHPAIINVFDFGQRENFYFFIMEFVDGTNLRQLVRSGDLDAKAALAVVPQICEALQYAHDEGIVHRDIKPENILIDRTGKVKVADFGLAKLIKPQADGFTLTGTQQVMGTPHYMAPEQLEHPLEVDHRADIYSLGVVIYEMLTGELPLGRFAPPSEKVQVDVRLDEVVLRALEKEPERRYQQVTEIKTGMEAASASPGPARDESSLMARIHNVFNDLRYPAYGLLVSSIIDVIVLVILLISAIVTRHHGQPVLGVILHVVGFAVYIGAIEMLRRGSYRWAIAAAVLAMLPFHFGAFLGIPFGIWSLMLLLRRDTRSQFNQPNNFESEIQSARQRTTAAFEQAGTKLQAIPWESLLIHRKLLSGIQRVRRTARVSVGLLVWTVVCLLAFSVSALLVARFASWKVRIFDQTANRVEGESGRLDVRGTGSTWQIGAFVNPANAIRDEVAVALYPNVAAGRKGIEQTLRVSIADMSFRTSSGVWSLAAPDAASQPFDSDTILDWMESMGVDTDSPTVQREATVLTDVVYEVVDDDSLGVTADRELAQLIDRNVLDVVRTRSHRGITIDQTPDVVPMALACAVNAILWLCGIGVVTIRAFRALIFNEVAHTKSRLTPLVVTVTILTLWTTAGFLARPLVTTHLPRAMVDGFPAEFSTYDTSPGLIADLTICVVWTIGVLLITIPAWILWRTGVPRSPKEDSTPGDETTDAEPTPDKPANAANTEPSATMSTD